MKKSVVIFKSTLIGMLVLGTTFPVKLSIVHATKAQQTGTHTPAKMADSQEASAADSVSVETDANLTSKINTAQFDPTVSGEDLTDIDTTDVEVDRNVNNQTESERLVNNTKQMKASVQTKSTENFNYDLTVEYDPTKAKALDLLLPIPEKYAQQTLHQNLSGAKNFYVYKTNEIYILKGMRYETTVLGTNLLSISWTSFTGSTINYYGLSAVIEYNDTSGNLLFTATYNIRFTNSHLTIKYVDKSGIEIYPSQAIDDSANEPYDVSTSAFIPQITGYILDTNQLPTNAKGTFPLGEITVTYIYQKAPTDYTDLTVKDTTIYERDTWTAADNFEQAISKEGQTLTYEEFIADGGSVSGQVDTAQADTYKINYHLNNVKKEATVLVNPRLTAITVHDSSLYVGEDWSVEDNFDQAVDRDNNPVDFADVNVEGSVDTGKVGTYEVMYCYDDVKSKAVITVKADLTAVNVHDSELYTGDKWDAEDNFGGAIDRDGIPVNFEDITVTGKVDTAIANKYEVSFSYHGIENKATVTVKADLTTLKVHDSTIEQGDEWLPETNFDYATDCDGKEVPFSTIEIHGIVDTDKIDQYTISYRYGSLTAYAIITVQAKESNTKIDGSLNTRPETSNKEHPSYSSKNTIKEFKQSTADQLPKAGEKSSLLMNIRGLLFLIGGATLFYYRKKNT